METEGKGNKKRAAILTWCNNNGPTNYGQILQCYAVRRIVSDLGYDAFVVLYQRKGALAEERTKRGEKFSKFIEKHIPHSDPCYTREGVERATEDCELLVCGSDQIWNPVCFDPIYFLDFGKREQKRVAFAASGIFEERQEYREIYEKIAKLIGRFDRVTMREQTGVDILRKYTGREIQAAPDPTLQLRKAEWDEVAGERLTDGDYIFCYVLGSLRPYQLILREAAKLYGVGKILFIPSNLVDEGAWTQFYPIRDAGPSEFISLVKNARVVCTDSFHGVAMSIVYGIPFFALPRIQPGAGAYNSMVRIEDLLKERGLEARSVRNVRDVKMAMYRSVL